MSVSLGDLVFYLKANNKDFDKSLNEAEGKAKGFSSRVGGILKGVAIGGAVAGVGAVVGLTAALVDATKEAAKSEEVQAQLNAVLKSTKGVAGVTAKQANKLADAMAKVTRFDDEAVLSAENLLLTFTSIKADVFPDATEIVLDMSQALGQDLKSSAIQLGKALQDPVKGVTALRRVGVNFSDEQIDVIKRLVETGQAAKAQQLILAELRTEFGGSARAAGQTFAGQLDILRTAIDNVKERIGAMLLPTLTQLVTTVGPRVIDFLNGFADALEQGGIGGGIDFIKGKLGELSGAVLQFVKDSWPAVETELKTWPGKMVQSFKDMFSPDSDFSKNLAQTTELQNTMAGQMELISNDPVLQAALNDAGQIIGRGVVKGIIGFFKGEGTGAGWDKLAIVQLYASIWRTARAYFNFFMTIGRELSAAIIEGMLRALGVPLSAAQSAAFRANLKLALSAVNLYDIGQWLWDRIVGGLLGQAQPSNPNAYWGGGEGTAQGRRPYGYAEGGIVPGALGQPQLALVHGGEAVLTPQQQGGVTINVGGITINGGGGGLTTGGVEASVYAAMTRVTAELRRRQR